MGERELGESRKPGEWEKRQGEGVDAGRGVVECVVERSHLAPSRGKKRNQFRAIISLKQIIDITSSL